MNYKKLSITIKNAVKKNHFWRLIVVVITIVFLTSQFPPLARLAFGGSSLISTAYAAAQAVRVSPVIINVSLSPGKTYQHELTIENLTETPLPFRAVLNDFVTTSEEGGYTFETTRDNPLLKWITLSETEFILGPKEKKKIQMTITTPKTISLGGYYGILFFEPVLQNTQHTTQISSKVGILMLANVGVQDPNAKKAEILTFSTGLLDQDGDVPLLLRVKNISLNFFTAKPILTVSPLLGSAAKEAPFEEKVIFPGQVRRWTDNAYIQDLTPNIYKAQMAVSTGQGKYVTTEKYFIVFPAGKAVGIITALIILGFLIIKRNRLSKALKELLKSN